MPGSTPNTNILLAIDQVIEAINGLETSSGTGDIVAKLEEIKTSYETLSTAGIVAQNTNFSDLITAMQELTLSCQTIVNTTNATYKINCGGCSGPGEYPPVEPDEEAGDPPIGWSDPPAPIIDRKCKVANAFHENIKEWVAIWDSHAVDDVAGTLVQGGISAFMAYLGTIIGELSTPIPLIDATIGATIGYLLGQAIKLFAGDFDLDRMNQILSDPDNQADFICAAYEPSGSAGIISGYLQVASNKGMNLADLALLASIVTADLANYAFFAREQYIEDALESYSPSFDCSTCLGFRFDFEADTETWTFVSEDETGGDLSGSHEPEFLVTSLQRSTTGSMQGYWRYNGPLIGDILEGMTIRAEVVTTAGCACGSSVGILWDDMSLSQGDGGGEALLNDQPVERELLVPPFNGLTISEIRVYAGSGTNCTTPGSYNVKVNWVEVN